MGDQIQPDRTHTKAAGGHWVFRDADIHRCNKPVMDNQMKNGDIWECDTCHKRWAVKMMPDYRNGSYLSWERVSAPQPDMRDARPFVDREQHR